MRGKADFKALREALGLSQSDVADACMVRTTTVKRWERPGFPGAPNDAWAYLEGEARRHDDMVAYAVARARDARAVGQMPDSVVITYYRDQDQYDALGRDDGPFSYANAVARDVAAILQREDFVVEFAYPDDGAIRTPGSRY